MSTPNTEIHVCADVRLDNRYTHSIYFDNKVTQWNYFSRKVVKSFTAYSYCRKTWKIKVDASLESAVKWNYLFFDNGTTVDTKTWFYFINNVEYVNDNTVELTLELDVIQTYMFDWGLLPCYIDRSHTVSDNYAEHTIEENLDTGELIGSSTTDVSSLEDLCVLILASRNLRESEWESESTGLVPAKIKGTCYNGIFSGLRIFAVDVTQSNSRQFLANAIANLDSSGYSDCIMNMWMYPKKLIEIAQGQSWDATVDEEPIKTVISTNSKFETLTINCGFVTKNNTTWKPKNKKLYCYPYHFIQCSNNQGGSAVYRFEYFSKVHEKGFGDVQFELKLGLYGAYSPEAGVKMVLQDYTPFMGQETAIYRAGYPSCAWNADSYKIWLAQNQNSQDLSFAMSGLTIAGGVGTAIAGIATSNPLMAIGGATAAYGGASQIASQLSQRADRQIQSPQSRGTHSSSVEKVAGKNTFSFITRCLSPEYAQAIDDYFTMYGYKRNIVEKPNINARPHFTYVKTIGCTIDGFIGNDDRVKIEGIFDAGITFWKEGDQIGNYTLDNRPIGIG